MKVRKTNKDEFKVITIEIKIESEQELIGFKNAIGRVNEEKFPNSLELFDLLKEEFNKIK